MIPLFLSSALAAPAPVTGLGLGLAGSGEAVMQGGLVDAYPKLSGSFSGEALVTASLRWPVEVGLEVGYRRLSGTNHADESSWIWYAPVSLLVSGRLDMGAVTLLGGAGPALVTWQEKSSSMAVSGRQDWGARWGALVEASGRYHTPWLRPAYPGAGGPAGLDLFASVGARFSDVADSAASASCHEDVCGFDWSAIRLSGGVLVRF